MHLVLLARLALHRITIVWWQPWLPLGFSHVINKTLAAVLFWGQCHSQVEHVYMQQPCPPPPEIEVGTP
jgi:hypothetical protein